MLARAAVVGLVAVLALVGAKTASPTTRADVAAPPHVTLFGDSVAEGIIDNPPARAVVAKGLDVRFEVAPCRRVGNLSCPFNGVRPPNVIDVVNDIGSALGPTVVVAVGYNDYADQYATNIEDAVSLMSLRRQADPLAHSARGSCGLPDDERRDLDRGRKAQVAGSGRLEHLFAASPGLVPERRDPRRLHGAVGMATLIHTALQRLVLQPPKKVGHRCTSSRSDYPPHAAASSTVRRSRLREDDGRTTGHCSSERLAASGSRRAAIVRRSSRKARDAT